MRWIGVVIIIGIVVVGIFFGTRGDEERIDEANAAAGGATQADDRPQEGRVSVFDLREGDCYDLPSSDEVVLDVGDVELVPCGGAEYKVLDLVPIRDSGPWPGRAAIDTLVTARCPRTTELFLAPTEDSWKLGDRAITCVEEL